jgi:signal transduction histidine kinase
LHELSSFQPWGLALSRSSFAQIFDAPAEIVIAYGRLVFTSIALAAIVFDPTKPVEYANVVRSALILYGCYSTAALAAQHWQWVRKPNALVAHAIDLLALSLLTILTEGFFSPFLVVFNFVLVAASLRWDWRGVLITTLLLALLSGLSAAIGLWNGGELESLNELIIRTGYLFVMAILLGYSSAHREYRHQRLTALARWRPTVSLDRGNMLGEALKQAASVFEARCALAMWETDEGAWEAALWHGSRCEILKPSSQAPIAVPVMLGQAAFSRTMADPDRLNLIGTAITYAPHALKGELVSTLPIVDFSSAALEGSNISGRLFLIGNIRASDDHLFLTRIVADRVSAELDRQIFSERAAAHFALREREAIARDLHDGLLQNLTAARAQLELVPTDAGVAAAQLQSSRDLLRIEQQRIRRFVELIRSADSEEAALDTLRPILEESARTWGCALSLELVPASAKVPRKLLNHLALMLAETMANAVRHGEAQSITIAVRQGASMEVKVRDDGRGFPVAARSNRSHELTGDDLPKSLYSRASHLGGRLRVSTSTSGTDVYFELPL